MTRLRHLCSHHSGQVCLSGSRIYVQEGIYDKFIAAFAERAKAIVQGDGFDAGVDQGPLISKTQLDVRVSSTPTPSASADICTQRVLGYVESGKQEGGTLVAGGARTNRAGYFVQPTIFADVTPDMKISREEIFGPVAVVAKFKTEDEVVALANDTEYGLAGYVYSQNINRAIRVAHQLEVGSTFVSSSDIAYMHL